MKAYIKYLFVSLFLTYFLIVLQISAAAADFDEELLDISGARDIDISYSEEYLDKYNIELDNAESISNISVGTFFSAILDIAHEKINIPIRLFLSSLGAIFIMAAVKAGVEETAFSCRNIAVAVVSSSLCSDFLMCIETVCGVVEDGAGFLSGFVPAFSAITLFSGSPGASGVYNSAMLSFCAFASDAVSHLLLPLLSCALALSVVNAVSPCVNLSALTNALKKIIISVLAFTMVIFIGLLALQTSIANSSDTLAMRASKYIVSSSIPIVGSAVGEAYSSVSAGIGVIKSTLGGFGIICLAFLALPVIISTFLVYFSMKLSAFAAQAFDVCELKTLFDDVAAVVSIVLAIAVCFFTMAIISTAIIILFVGG